MALTRANVESILIQRVGKLLTAASLDGTTVNGSNATLNDPIGWSVRQCGATVDDYTAVDNDDVARVSTSDYDKLLDLAELRALETIAGNLDDVDTKVDDVDRKFSQFMTQVERMISRKRAQVSRDYGAGAATLTAGVITLGFQQQNDEATS